MASEVRNGTAESPTPQRSARVKPAWVRWIDRSSLLLLVPSAAVCVVLMLHVVVDVVGRTLFNHPLPSTLEIVSDWWMVILVFGSFGYAQYRGEHVRATILTDNLPRSWQRGAEAAALLLMGAVGVLIALYGWTEALHSMAIDETLVSSTPVVVWPFKFLIPLGGLALALQCVASIYLTLAGIGQETHDEAELV